MDQDRQTKQTFIEWFPWEKFTIWTLFLGTVYVLRHFFFIMFMTFIISYLMRSLIRFLAGLVAPGSRRVWHEQALTIICFILLLAGCYGLGRYFVPQLARQGQALIKKVGNLEETPRAKVNSILRGTVGQWLFQQEYGPPEDTRYQDALQSYLQTGLRVKEYEDFGRFITRIQSTFEKDLIKKFSVVDDPDSIPSASPKSIQTSDPLPTMSERARDVEAVRHFREQNPQDYKRLFRQFYEKYPAERGVQKPPFETVMHLWDAYREDPATFSARYGDLVLSGMKPDDRLETDRASFTYHESRNLVTSWKQGPMAEKIGVEVERKMIGLLGSLGNHLGSLIPVIVTLPIQLALSLMLSFFITFDLTRLSRGIERLRKSRAANFYAEIAPGLVSFGKLIGRAFQAQGVIAFINMLLTLVVIKVLGIENELFLSAIVFICSFIPVLGVVLSGIPIAAMALIQDGGGLGVALWSIVGILVVHFIETSLLNPKIVGTFLHLHPVLVLAILAIGEHFFGIWGLLLGVPVVVYIIRIVIFNEGLPWEKRLARSSL